TANTYAAKRTAYDHTPNARRAKLVATSTGPQAGYGGDQNATEKPVDTWQCVPNEIQKDIKTLPSFLALEDANPGITPYVESLLEARRRGEHPVANFNTFGASDADINTALILLNRLSKGT